MFKIEKNVPMPEGRTPRPVIWPFALMQVGDSVLIPADKAKAARTVAGQVSRRRDMKFITRAVEDGIRVWRTE